MFAIKLRVEVAQIYICICKDLELYFYAYLYDIYNIAGNDEGKYHAWTGFVPGRLPSLSTTRFTS